MLINSTGMKIIELDRTISTNTYAAKLDPQPEMPFIVRANFQEKGRGQGDHSWESEANKNLLFSIVFEPKQIPVDKNFFVSKFIAICLLEFIRKYEPHAIIKWPNDILVNEKKIAGILIENTILSSSINRSIAGIGVNINEEIGLKNSKAISLKDLTANDFDISELLKEFIDVFISKSSLLSESGLKKINGEYLDNLFHLKQNSCFKSGDSSFEAMITDVQDDGQIVLKLESGELKRYSFGEIEYLFAEG